MDFGIDRDRLAAPGIDRFGNLWFERTRFFPEGLGFPDSYKENGPTNLLTGRTTSHSSPNVVVSVVRRQ